MKKVKIYGLTFVAMCLAAIALRAAEGAAWTDDGEWQTWCDVGQTTCEVWDQKVCEASPIFNPNCTPGDTKRENVRRGYCSLGWCEVGF